MLPDALMDAADALDGLLRVAYQQGQRDLGWDALCGLCEDAVVASWPEVWERDPAQACALLTDRTTRLVVHLTQHYGRKRTVRWDRQNRPQLQFVVLDLVRTLHALRGQTWRRSEPA